SDETLLDAERHACSECWSKAVGVAFHEVHIETNAHDLTLLFSDLEVSEVPVGYAPFIAD
ncbi:YxiG-like protein, partial [Streptomyces sp. NPDC001193]